MPKTVNPNSMRTQYGHLSAFFGLHFNTVRGWHRRGILHSRIARLILMRDLDVMETKEAAKHKKTYPAYGKKR